MHQSCVLWPGTRLKIEELRDFIITLLRDGMSLTDALIKTKELALCHKTIIFSTTTHELVSTGSIEYASDNYNWAKTWSKT